MFPYSENPISKLRTAADIERFGHTALLRALNIGRVVAFVGSGASMKFDQPAWSGISESAFLSFKSLLGALKKLPNYKTGYRPHLAPLIDEIESLKECKKFDTPYLIELIEDFHTDAAELISRDSAAISALSKVDWDVARFREQFSDQFLSRKSGKLRKPTKLATEVRGLGVTAKAHAHAIDKDRVDIDRIDAARVLRRRLGMRRFLTLNYDLELELMLFEEGRSTPEADFTRFRNYVLQKFEGSGEPDFERGRAVTLEGASGRVIRSTTSRKETLADLFSFGAFPTNYDASVHHLHGRIDDPENMIVTPGDYQRIYYGASDQKKTFDEARHAVFTGSDIFVLGMGTKEHDVLEPLRDFLELESERSDAHGKVYYIGTAEFSGTKANFGDALTEASLNARAQAQRLYKEYGMHPLLIDFSFDRGPSSRWTSEMVSLFAVRAYVAYLKKCVDNKVQANQWTNPDLKKAVEAVFGGGAKAPEFLQQPAYKLADELGQKWNSCLRGLEAKLSTKTFKKAKSNKTKIESALGALGSHLQDIGLVDFCAGLESARRNWWESWSELPGHRLAILGPHRYRLKQLKKDDFNPHDPSLEIKRINRGVLVWRQTNLASSFREVGPLLGNREETPQFTKLISITAEARHAAQKAAAAFGAGSANRILSGGGTQTSRNLRPASIARVSIPPGGGKGRLVSFFTSPQVLKPKEDPVLPFQALFNDSNVDADTTDPAALFPTKGPYAACFTAHLTHTLEFSSSMIAFARLLQQLLPDMRRESKSDDPRWGRLINRQFHERVLSQPVIESLREMFQLLQDTCPKDGWTTRIIAVFSYLDRLVDQNGDAYSPIHRAFFRLISGWDDPVAHLKLPIDLVLINCNANQPIRYLSEERRIDLNGEDRRDPRWRDAGWTLRRDRSVALRHWDELPRVRGRIVFMEGLEHAATVARSASAAAPKKVAEAILKALVGKKPRPDDNDFMPLPPNLRKFMYRRVAYGHMIAGLAYAIWAAHPKAQFRTHWDRATLALDIAHAREKARGVIEELLAIYRRLDGANLPGREKIDPEARIKTSVGTRRRERLRTMMIDHLALLNFPVTAATLLACPDVGMSVEGSNETADLKEITEELDTLVARGLAARYYKYADRAAMTKPGPVNPDGGAYVYALDTKVASVLRARANLEVYSHYRLVAFQPNVYPSQPEHALKPDVAHFERVSKVVRALVKPTHLKLVEIHEDLQAGKTARLGEPEFKKKMEAHNDRIRAAYALVRGTFSISVIARLAERTGVDAKLRPFDEYRTWTRKLLNSATLLSKIRGAYLKKHRTKPSDPLPFNHTFLRDEIAWLYNERGLVSFLQGRLFDALPLFEQSTTVLGSSPGRSAPRSDTATLRRVRMNHALAQVERGNIVAAKEGLARIVADTEPQWRGDTPSVMHCMATGYLALCDHLTNEFLRAKDGYEKAIAEIGKFDHPRAESIFRRHYGDLLRTMSKSRNDREYKEALTHLRSAEELALGIRATDLYHYALMAQARLHRDMEDRGNALQKLRHVEAYARSMGIQKMLCEVLKVRGEVLLADGETTQAGSVTSQSIAISKRNGMRLRKISAAIIQSRILRERGQRRDSERLLTETIIESQMLGYALKTSQAMDLINHPY